MKVAFDVGGVLTRYPRECRELIACLLQGGHEVFVVTDMPDRDKVVAALVANDFTDPRLLGNVVLARHSRHGDACKAVVLLDLGIDVLVDDHLGYLGWPWPTRAPLRLLVVPDPRRAYYGETWRGEVVEWAQVYYRRDQDPEGGVG
jgi:hypothetical protein